MKKIICMLAFLLPLTVQSYGLEGHLTILNIAFDQLSDTQKAKIKPLLSNILNQVDVPGRHFNPVVAASWLDDTRDMGVLNNIHYSGRVIYNPENISLPANASKVLFYKLDMYWNLDEAIYAFKKHNKDPETTPLSQFEQSLLLMYLVHLVGDAHQPLHMTEPLYKIYINAKNLYGETYGANSIKVNTSSAGECLHTTKLHAIWDGMGCLTDEVRKKYPPKTDTTQQYFLTAQQYFANNLLKDFSANVVKRATIDPKKYTLGFDTKTWINDLSQFQGDVFSAIDADIAKLKQPTDSIVLSKAYLQNVQQTTINLVYLAGIRLGYILNELFPDKKK